MGLFICVNQCQSALLQTVTSINHLALPLINKLINLLSIMFWNESCSGNTRFLVVDSSLCGLMFLLCSNYFTNSSFYFALFFLLATAYA